MITLIVFSHLRWKFVFQRPQHLMSRLAKRYKIVFVEEPLPTLEIPFMQQDVILPNVTIVVPHTNEEGWGFNAKQLPIIGDLLVKWIAHANLDHECALWFYTPQALPLREYFQPKFIVFDIMDELSLFAGAPLEIKPREAELLQIADVVIAGGPSLWKSKSKVRPDAILLSSAVDAGHFSPENAHHLENEKHVEDRLEHDIPHPRLGFFGVIDERLDIELLITLADHTPDWHIVMVGPVVKIDPATLPQRPNIHWLGPQNYQDLPMIVQGWEVCLLPFALNDSTRFISPTKTLEYMAAERPIVSTNIHDVAEMYGSVVAIANTHDEFIKQCTHALSFTALDMAHLTKKYKLIVAEHSWDSATTVVHNAIESLKRTRS